MLDEIHFLPNGALPYDVIVRLKNLKVQFRQHGRDEVGLRVGKQGHGGHQLATIEVDNFLEVEQ